MNPACAAGRFLPEIVQIRPLLRAFPSARSTKAGRGGVVKLAPLKRTSKCPRFPLTGSASWLAEWPEWVDSLRWQIDDEMKE